MGATPATPAPDHRDRTNPPLPPGTEVWVPTIGDTTVVSSEISPAGYVFYRCAGDEQPVSGMTVYRRRAMVPEPPADPVPPSMGGDRAVPAVPNAVHSDADATVPRRHAAMRTPAYLRQRRERARQRVFGLDWSNHPMVTPPLFSRDHRFAGPARLIVNGYCVNEDGLSFQVTVLRGLDRAAVPHDLILVTLDGPAGRRLDTVAVLTPPPDQNVCTFSASYTWNQLARMLGLRRAEKAAARGTVLAAMPQAGVTAEWWAGRDGRNRPRHAAGGLDQKNGSGRIDLRPITLDDLKLAESVPKRGWHAGEPLREDRPVCREFGDVLRPGMEMTTSLEPRSEFLITGEQHVSVVGRLRTLFARPAGLDRLGAGLMSAEDIRRVTDTHFDVPALTLLRCDVVLRRRELNTDEAGCFRLTAKGRSVVKAHPSGERIRLVSGVHLVQDPDGGRLAEFLAGTGTDNAFARVLADALGRHRGDLAEPKGWKDLAPRLVVTAQRVRYSFELAHSTTVGLYADSATGTDPATGRTATIHTLSFALVHPGCLPRDDDVPEPSAAPPPVEGRPGTAGTGRAAGVPARRVLVTRPYHVPSDLDGPALFDAPDYLRYQELRDRMLHYLFGYAAEDLEPGGDKARVLARRLGVI